MGLAGSLCNYPGWFGGANAPGVDDIHSGKMYVVSVSYKAIYGLISIVFTFMCVR